MLNFSKYIKYNTDKNPSRKLWLIDKLVLTLFGKVNS